MLPPVTPCEGADQCHSAAPWAQDVAAAREGAAPCAGFPAPVPERDEAEGVCRCDQELLHDGRGERSWSVRGSGPL